MTDVFDDDDNFSVTLNDTFPHKWVDFIVPIQSKVVLLLIQTIPYRLASMSRIVEFSQRCVNSLSVKIVKLFGLRNLYIGTSNELCKEFEPLHLSTLVTIRNHSSTMSNLWIP